MKNLQTGNLLRDVPEDRPEELFSEIVTADGVRIERIVSNGQATPEGKWYDQDTREWVILLKGQALVRFEGGDDLEMTPGDYVLIPAHCRHRVEWTSDNEPTVWLAVHYDAAEGERAP